MDINKGVTCKVTSCTYYKDGSKCTADKINVSDMTSSNTGAVNSVARRSDDTFCNTFKPK